MRGSPGSGADKTAGEPYLHLERGAPPFPDGSGGASLINREEEGLNKLIAVLAVVAILGGLAIFAAVGDTLWVAPDIERTHTSMVFLCLLFLLFPTVSLIMGKRRE